MPTFNSCTKCVGRPGIINDRMPDCHPVSWAWMRPQVLGLTTERSFLICKLRGSLMCLSYCFDTLSIGVCTTRHWQTSGRLVQEFDVCTVPPTRAYISAYSKETRDAIFHHSIIRFHDFNTHSSGTLAAGYGGLNSKECEG